MLKDKKEQPKDRGLQEHKETHTSKGKLALFSLSTVKGQVCVCSIPLGSAKPGSAEWAPASIDSVLRITLLNIRWVPHTPKQGAPMKLEEQS